jgi:acyl-[acyl-carrier-protein]-phospholipid O-acyltransferase/long-chain-fatty-acid--[acyl-carrier-protein] ligase
MLTLARWLLRLCFGFRTFGAESLGVRGPALLIPNHVSWLDWLFLGVVLDDDWRFVTSSRTAETSWIHRRLMKSERTFPVDMSSPYAVRDMATYLEKGGRLVLFAEGRISTTGVLMKLFDGTGFLIRKTGARVITCYLRGANRLRWVRHRGWRKWFPRVSAHFSAVFEAPPPRPGCSHTEDRHHTTAWLRDRMVTQQFEVEMAHGPGNLPAAIAETGASLPGFTVLEDVSATELTYRRLFAGANLLAGVWRERLGPAPRVGLLLPNVNGTPVAILSLWAAGKVPALLNFSSGVPTILACARLAGLRQVITSRAFLEKARLDLAPFAAEGIGLLYLEDIRAGIAGSSRIAALLAQVVSPGTGLRQARQRPEDTAVVLFTSGSEGTPKGVELTHANLLANIRQVTAVLDITDHDRFFNALPLFHSFGLTGGTLFPLVRGCYTFLYPTPLHYRIVPALVYDRQCTVLMGTNTFLNGYARMAHPYDFTTLRFLVGGAEKVQSATLETWSRKFGVRIGEGYGATECGPVVSLNTRMEPGVGSAGRFLPGIEHRLEPVEGVTEGGRLFVRGPNVMKGYLNPEANAAFHALGGWYDTGDIAKVDANGFLHILGRLKRFAKVSGEMVSLTAVEDALAGAFPHYGLRCQIAVVTRPDEDKGEALIAVSNEPRLQLAEIRAVLKAKGLTNLSMPREILAVPAIPKLGTGKIDHRGLQKQLAEQPP